MHVIATPCSNAKASATLATFRPIRAMERLVPQWGAWLLTTVITQDGVSIRNAQ